MMNGAVFLVLIALISQSVALTNKFLTTDDAKFEASAAGQYGKYDSKFDSRASAINNVAVFLLGTLANAVQFGESELGAGFYDRAVASRMTW